MKNPERFASSHPERRGVLELRVFFSSAGVAAKVCAGAREDGGELAERSHFYFGSQEPNHPFAVAAATIFGVEEKSARFDEPPAKKHGARKRGEVADPGVMEQGHLNLAVAEVFALFVHHDDVAEEHVHIGVLFKVARDFGECAGQVLFVAVEIGEDVAVRAAQAAVDGIIHSAICFNVRFDAGIMREPFRRAVGGAGVLHDVLKLWLRLIRNGGDAEFQPVGLVAARGDDGESRWHVAKKSNGLNRAEAGLNFLNHQRLAGGVTRASCGFGWSSPMRGLGMGGSDSRRNAFCSFCRKSYRDVGPLVEGPGDV